MLSNPTWQIQKSSATGGELNLIKDEPEMIIFYTTENDLKNLNLSNIKGISYFTSDENRKSSHKAYTRNGNNFVNDKRFNVETGINVHLGDINLLSAIAEITSRHILIT